MEKTHQKGMFALSGDPFTFGHLDVVKRSLEFCEKLIVLIANNGAKTGRYLFTLTERIAIAKRVIEEADLCERVEVIGSSGLLFDEFSKHNVDLLIRGVRDTKDEKYEKEQLEIQRLFTNALPEQKVFFLQASEQYRVISSTFVKGAVEAGLEVDRFVSLFVKELLEERILGQYKIGITGGIGSGKTFVGRELAEMFNQHGIKATVVNFDELQRALYREKSSGAEQIRLHLRALFGSEVLSENGEDVNRPYLAEKIFNPECSRETREQLSKLVKPHIDRLYREALRGAKGIIILEWAQLAENNLFSLVNGNVIVVDAPSDDRKRFLVERAIPEKRLSETLRHQWPLEKKVAASLSFAEKAKHGAVVVYENSYQENKQELSKQIYRLMKKVATILNLQHKE